jgi:phosphoenolpyruvate carboxylase
LASEIAAATNGATAPGAIEAGFLGAILSRVHAQAAADPFSNPILLFALDLTLRIDRGEINLDGLESLVQGFTAEAFADRAKRLASYLGETAIAANELAIAKLLERKAGAGGFEEFRAALAGSVFGVVFTAHPTFVITLELARSLAELATGQTVSGAPLDQAGRDARIAAAIRL